MVKLMLVMVFLFFLLGILPLALILPGLTKLKIPKLGRYIIGVAYLIAVSELIGRWLFPQGTSGPANPLITKLLNLE